MDWNSLTDEYFLGYLTKSKSIKEQTKDMYRKKIQVIKEEVWTEKDKRLSYILQNPLKFIKYLDTFACNTKGRLKNKCLGFHTRDTYISALMSLFNHNQDLRNEAYDLFLQWKEEHDKIRQPIDNKYKSNEPTERQKEAYVSFEEVIATRNKLRDGSIEKLLLTIYTEIPPVRSDYYLTKVYPRKPKSVAEDENYIINRKTKPVIVLQEYKTSSKYKTITIAIPPELKRQITLSLQETPRSYLFVSTRNNQPYNTLKSPEKSFNSWANYVLKQIFNDAFHLTMLRHIYISRRDLKLEEQSGLQKDKIAALMGHSVQQQDKYTWFTFLKKKENEDAKATTT
jgi:hypothetical protein